jgi:hypothetical protein
MKQQNWGDSKPEEIKSTDERTFDDSEIEFENTSGLAKKYLNMKIGELVRVRGGVQGLKEWSSIYKMLITADKTDQDLRERRNQLIEKDFAISNLKKYIDLFMEEVFNTAEAQTETIISLVLSDIEEARKEIPKLRMKSYSKIAKNTKKSLKDSMKRLKVKYDNSDD